VGSSGDQRAKVAVAAPRVSVSSLWADEKLYWPLDFEPYTPAHHCERGKEDSCFRTKREAEKGGLEGPGRKP
jgi:hypothetical protein